MIKALTDREMPRFFLIEKFGYCAAASMVFKEERVRGER